MDPEDGTHPIKTYGWSMEEVLEKVARTAEAAQQVINRQRRATQAPANPPARAVAAPPPPAAVTADEQMQATADLSNPAKAPGAIKTLLRAQGFDLDAQTLKQEATKAAAVAQEWERTHADFPSDDRNKRLLMDRALLLANGKLGQITAQIFDDAYQYLLSYGMLFEAEAVSDEPPTRTDAPDGNTAPVVRQRNATSYRRTALSGAAPAARREQPKYTRAQVDAMNSKQLRDKIEGEPGFADWYNREFSRSATA
jgi:hypothetical protein